MGSAIFTNGSNAYQVSGIIYAGSVAEIPEKLRQNGHTHSFKITTGLGTVFCHYKDEETARKSRGVLAEMLDATKPHAFKHGFEFVDPTRVVSFSGVLQFKKPLGQYTHGFVVRMETVDEKGREVWLRYRSEDHAQKGRKALWATLHNVNGVQSRLPEKAPATQTAVANSGLPF